MNTRKLAVLFIVLVLFYICFQGIARSLNHGHHVDYTLKDKETREKFTVNETRTTRVRGEEDNYYFEIKTKNSEFNFQSYFDFKKRNYVIKDIKYFKDDQYECIYPIFKDSLLQMDMICQKNGIQYQYANMEHQDKKLKQFEKNLNTYGYYKKQYQNYSRQKKEYRELSYYPKNILENHIFAIDYYKGVYILSRQGIKKIPLFEQDIYEKTIRDVVSKYYVIANYNQKYDFDEIYLVNLENGKQDTLHSDNPISFDSYIQGKVKDSLYLLDTDHKKQYEINVKSKKVTLIGDEEKGIQIFEDGKWETKRIYSYINNKVLFTDNYSKVFKEQYQQIDKRGKNLSGYYYLYQKKKNYYQGYQANVQNTNLLTATFITDDIQSIDYSNEGIYYKNGNNIYRYYQYNKIPILTNREFEFNPTLKVMLYEK